jgi:hypothetical protein
VAGRTPPGRRCYTHGVMRRSRMAIYYVAYGAKASSAVLKTVLKALQ